MNNFCIGLKLLEVEITLVLTLINFYLPTDYCAAPPSTGNCRASFTRYYYDPEHMACKTFIYGGCKPKENNYLSEADCMKMCHGRSGKFFSLVSLAGPSVGSPATCKRGCNRISNAVIGKGNVKDIYFYYVQYLSFQRWQAVCSEDSYRCRAKNGQMNK